jgi:hypothetical protein
VVRPAKIACIEPGRIDRRVGRLDKTAVKAVSQWLRGFLGQLFISGERELRLRTKPAPTERVPQAEIRGGARRDTLNGFKNPFHSSLSCAIFNS